MTIATVDDRNRFIALLTESLTLVGTHPPSFVSLTLSRPVAGPGGAPDLSRIDVRLIYMRGQEALSCNFRYQRRDETKNFPVPEGITVIDAAIGGQFLNADLQCQGIVHSLRTDKKGKSHLISRRQPKGGATAAAGIQSHDRIKHRFVDPGQPWLRLVGISDSDGLVLPRMQDKFRQIDKFVEIINDLVATMPLAQSADKQLSLLDMGSGKAYLTFALFDFLRTRFTVAACGIEQREGLVESCNSTATAVGFAPEGPGGSGLTFIQGTIENWQPKADSRFARPDVLVALHACDTATDDALLVGIRSGAALIICSPCCHKQVRSDLQASGIITSITRHGILEERLAEILTDSIRALVLEAHGYKVKVFEFISTEHTGKNLMISAVRLAGDIVTSVQAAKLAQAKELAASFGLTRHYLLEKLA